MAAGQTAGQTRWTRASPPEPIRLEAIASFPGLRVLAWDGDTLYASRGYTLLRARPDSAACSWQPVGSYSPPWWRKWSAKSRLTYRLFRDGFHALAVLPSGHLVGAVPGAILTLAPGETAFRLSHAVLRGTRPLHLAVTPAERIFWGEYFNNPAREAVHVFVSSDRGLTWDVAFRFPPGAVRHVHNIVYDAWADCLWILTGDIGSECRILRASCDFKAVETVRSGHQQARAAALVPAPEGVYFASDSPLESNFIYLLDRSGRVEKVGTLPSSSISGCQAADAIFFATMVEPSRCNRDRHVHLVGSRTGRSWQSLMCWTKDSWPMSFFQYGNSLLPDGRNNTGLLACTTVAVRGSDLATSLWRVSPG